MLLADGHRVVCWDLHSDGLEWLRDDPSDRILTAAVDVTDAEAVHQAADEALTAFGRVDLLVNAAGIYLPGGLTELSLDRMKALFEVNVVGTAITTRALATPLMEAGGAVVNVASVVAGKPAPASSYYAASKAAVLQLTRSWALELAEHGVRVNAVAPGVVDTALFAAGGLSDDDVSDFLTSRASENPLGRIGHPDEVAGWILRLGLEDEWVTGVVLPVAGGMALT